MGKPLEKQTINFWKLLLKKLHRVALYTLFWNQIGILTTKTTTTFINTLERTDAKTSSYDFENQ